MPAGYRRWLNKIEKDKKNIDITVTDDVNLRVKTKGKSYFEWIRHDFGNITPTTKRVNHTSKKSSPISQLKSNGDEYPDSLVVQNEYEGTGVSDNGNWIVTTPSMIRAKDVVNTRGSRANTSGDIAKRLVFSRGRIPQPGAIMHERTDEGIDRFTFFNKKLQEKSESIPERMTIAVHQDIQTGSITSRHELEAKNIDYVRTRIMGERAVAWAWLGDQVQGRNYPHFASESQMTGLMSMDSQEGFLLDVLEKSFENMSFEEMKAIDRITTQNGNHEYNSGTLKWHGYSFITSLRQLFEKKFSDMYGRQFAREGYSDEQIDKMVSSFVREKVKSHEAMITPEGEYFTGYFDMEYFNDMGVLFQHTHLHRGGKGGGGALPSYQAQGLMEGQGALMRSVDLFMQGHWHHPNFVILMDKISITGGSMAGLSDYEFKRGYRPTIAGNLIHIGGGLPVQLEFLSKDFLENYKIESGAFTDARLREEGYETDENWNSKKHGIYLPDDFPKSALQKKLIQMHRDASQRKHHITEMR
jgi:hypothetical protein